MMDTLKDLPEFFEQELGEALRARTESLATFRELGPPDLCHITKASVKPPAKEIGSYHFVSGVDASSSASVAAYISSLQYLTEGQAGWFSKNAAWRIRSGIYCCYNAISRIDVRVQVNIPGGVDSHVVDQRGERHEAVAGTWEETFISAMVRSFLYADDASYKLAGYRKLDPIPNLAAEKRFLEAASQLFWKGWHLGSDPEVQVPTSTYNHLASGLMKYFSESLRHDVAAEFFKPLFEKDPEVGALLAGSYLGKDEEVKAVQILYDGLRRQPLAYPLLIVQVDFLREKGNLDLAVRVAKKAVKCAPSDFVAWAKLTEVYVEIGDYDSALLTLNSCPMFNCNERDIHRMPPPARAHFPIKAELQNVSGFDDDPSISEVEPSIQRLPAPTLRGTFAAAYKLLTQLVKKIGWDELLKRRSRVFVMEEEYRVQKAAEEEEKNKRNSATENGAGGESNSQGPEAKEAEVKKVEAANDGTHITETRQEDPDNNAPEEQGKAEAEEERRVQEAAEGEKEDKPALENGANGGNAEGPEAKDEERERAETANDDTKTAQAHPEDKVAEEQRKVKAGQPSQAGTSLSSKRLCERWLDNLFMVLYDDLRAYTIWRAEMAHFKSQNMPYRKYPTEWELLGDLALRLHHKDEALDAFYRCLESRFSAKAHQRALELNAAAGNLPLALSSIVKLVVFQERWYNEMLYPTPVSQNLFKLIRRQGLSKVKSALQSMTLPPAMEKLVIRYFAYAEAFKIEGSQL